jgi:hypothetical protein
MLVGFLWRWDFLVSHSGLPKLIDEHLPFENLEDATMPVHIVTTDIVSGNAVVLCEGSAREAITATTSTASRFGHRQIRVAFSRCRRTGRGFSSRRQSTCEAPWLLQAKLTNSRDRSRRSPSVAEIDIIVTLRAGTQIYDKSAALYGRATGGGLLTLDISCHESLVLSVCPTFCRADVAQQSKHWSYETLQEFPGRPRARENANTKQNGQQHFRQILGGLGFHDGAVLLACHGAPEKKCLNLYQRFRNNALTLRIVRSNFERCVHQQASAPQLVTQRSCDDFFQKCDDSLPRGKPFFQTFYSLSNRLQIVVKRKLIERPLVSEGIVQASAGDIHAVGEVPNRSCLVAILPELPNRSVQHDAFLEFPWPCHSRSLVLKRR